MKCLHVLRSNHTLLCYPALEGFEYVYGCVWFQEICHHSAMLLNISLHNLSRLLLRRCSLLSQHTYPLNSTLSCRHHNNPPWCSSLSPPSIYPRLIIKAPRIINKVSRTMCIRAFVVRTHILLITHNPLIIASTQKMFSINVSLVHTLYSTPLSC